MRNLKRLVLETKAENTEAVKKNSTCASLFDFHQPRFLKAGLLEEGKDPAVTAEITQSIGQSCSLSPLESIIVLDFR